MVSWPLTIQGKPPQRSCPSRSHLNGGGFHPSATWLACSCLLEPSFKEGTDSTIPHPGKHGKYERGWRRIGGPWCLELTELETQQPPTDQMPLTSSNLILSGYLSLLQRVSSQCYPHPGRHVYGIASDH